MKYEWSQWSMLGSLSSISFTCGFCGTLTGTNHGYNHSQINARIYICTYCGCPSYFFNTAQYPGPKLGREISKLPEDINEIYQEIRDSIKVANYTAAELLGRKLIMHLAVDIAKAPEGKSFVEYVQHLKDSGYIPPNGEKWLDYVRTLGNEQNHEIKIGKKENSEKILKFIEVLLIFIYEFSGDFEDDAAK